MSTLDSPVVADRYRLVAPLGRGGMGRVWRARDEVLDRDVAVKQLVVPPGLDESYRDDLRRRSIREARAIARLNHPNVVRVFDVLRPEGDDPWIVMEFVDGQSLQEALPLPVARVAEIGLAILAALEAAHAEGVVHRDVKPANVLLAADGRVVLTDFGLATVPGDPHVTQPGMMFGSPAYLAPERAREAVAGPASDLWSLGATLYAAVEGRPPFCRATAIATLTALTSEPVPPPQRAGALAPVVMGLLAKYPANRLPAATARVMLQDVADQPSPTRPLPVQPTPTRVLAADSTQTRPLPVQPAPVPASRPHPVRRRSRTPLAAVLTAVLLVALSVLAYQAWVRPEQGPGGANPTEPAVSPQAPASASPTAAATSSPPSGFVLQPGWRMRDDGTGFAVPVPATWRFSRDDDGRPLWRDPKTGTFLLIDQTRQPKDDPVQDWLANEAARRDGYRDYERIRIEAVDYYDRAADWEFTYTGGSGTRLHVLNRGFVTAPDQAYSIYWSTRADRWAAELPRLQVVIAGFRPAR